MVRKFISVKLNNPCAKDMQLTTHYLTILIEGTVTVEVWSLFHHSKTLIEKVDHLFRLRHGPTETDFFVTPIIPFSGDDFKADRINAFKILTGQVGVDPNLPFLPSTLRGLREHPYKVRAVARRENRPFRWGSWNTGIRFWLSPFWLVQ